MDEDRAEDVLFGAIMRTHTRPSAIQKVNHMSKRVQIFVGDIKRHLGEKAERRGKCGPGR